MDRVRDKVVAISGGTGGIGAATARLIASEGGKVAILDVADGRDLAREIGGDFYTLDVTSETGWADTIGAIDQKHGRIDALVNAAGIEGDLQAGNPETTSLAEWRRVHSINLDGTFLGCRAVLPIMKRRKLGSIINISSIVSYFGSPNAVAYSTSKGGVQTFTKSVARYGARGGNRVRCNSVHPGVIRTRMIKNIWAETARLTNRSVEEAERLSLRMVPFGALGEPEDVAFLILYLVSDESRYVTGSEFQVDGGWHLVEARS
jgi:NAD(P)-dependent dehydrogenase (short-subunit alcohol dehydrogenase family)